MTMSFIDSFAYLTSMMVWISGRKNRLGNGRRQKPEQNLQGEHQNRKALEWRAMNLERPLHLKFIRKFTVSAVLHLMNILVKVNQNGNENIQIGRLSLGRKLFQRY